MAESESQPAQSGLTDPPASLWAELGVAPEAEIHGGFQSKVVLATGRGGRLIVKLIEADQAGELARKRAAVARRLADINPAAVGPLTVGPELVHRAGRWNAVCYPYVEGPHPRVDDRGDVEAMAETLASIHRSLATLTGVGLPQVEALAMSDTPSRGQGRLIHGDYAPANLIVTSTGLRVIDFDECGQGSVEFEIGNTLYMVLFDAWNTGTLGQYLRFRSWFVDAYRKAATLELNDALLDESIHIRLKALGRWLADPAGAPIGIRTANPEWRRRLHSFVAHFDSEAHVDCAETVERPTNWPQR